MRRYALYQWLSATILFGMLPFLIHVMPLLLGRGTVFFPSNSSLIGAFVLLGMASGAIFGRLSLVGEPIAFVVSIVTPTKMKFIGGGGDGDFFCYRRQ